MKIGVFADLHYAKNKQYGTRFCNLSLEKLKILIWIFNTEKVDFVVCLGDIIDSSGSEQQDKQNILRVAECFGEFNAPVYAVMGNHDLEAMSKQTFLKTLGSMSMQRYFSFLREDVLFMMLDANNTESCEYDKGNYEWEDSFLDEEQTRWLNDTLENTGAERVYIFTHQNIDERYTEKGELDPHIIKNCRAVMKILKDSGKSITVLQGHYHYGCSRTIDGIEYVTQRAVVEGSSLESIPYMIISI